MQKGRRLPIATTFQFNFIYYLSLQVVHSELQKWRSVDNDDQFYHGLLVPRSNQESSPPVKLHVTDKHVEIDNGIVKLTLLKPAGLMSSLGYKGVSNILEYRNAEERRGYWDIVWSRPDRNASYFDTLECTSFRVIAETDDQVEVSFTKTWHWSVDTEVPLNIDKRYIILRGSSGFYSYSIFEHLEGWPDLNIDEARIAFKLHQDMFHYMVISDDKQRIMPSERDRRVGDRLDYREAVLLTHPSNPRLRGEVDDKYQYSCENKDNHVHGWISSDPSIGFWVITPSDEFRAGGPVKQDLTSHAGTTSLSTFFSAHYAGPSFGVRLRNGEQWKKVFGPVFFYLNSDSTDNNPRRRLWEDAKRQTAEETKKWPYDFPLSGDFPRAKERGAITGRLLVRERYTGRAITAAKSAYVGLATPGDVGSWQEDTKGYQFWTKTDKKGHFSIRGVRPGRYNLYGWVAGVIGDYKYHGDIIIQPGNQVRIGDLVYYPPRNGPTLWEIGIPDRTAAEFYIPDPPPGLVNRLYINHTEKYRQYGLWNRYTDLYPDQDLTYTVGVSDYRKHWFFAHVNRHVNRRYVATTWRIVFNARNVIRRGRYTLRIALASASFGEIKVEMNKKRKQPPLFSTGRIGRDNAIARHGIHGLYRLYNVTISGSQLKEGTNTIYLTQSRPSNPFFGVMYDYIRFEAPPP
ncbi:Rhamnogalacturonate lyase family protein [Perilla frutescens var. hirtella]|uniref:rhamnogalacturonan endolyase n=1 Tax=Perilla frutescens var. hirtella TaxID=608512 RepID=A0AAD4PFS3_PERFH|nr:Rhamnogalacturonate lyase family protein [Perilla frutescens var. hirtella]